jgi:hypothetical protein
VRIVLKLLAETGARALVLEAPDAHGSRRRPRIRKLLRATVKAARERKVTVVEVARQTVRKLWLTSGVSNKEEAAARIAAHIPVLSRLVPPARKCWKSETARVNVFDAVSLALASEAIPSAKLLLR